MKLRFLRNFKGYGTYFKISHVTDLTLRLVMFYVSAITPNGLQRQKTCRIKIFVVLQGLETFNYAWELFRRYKWCLTTSIQQFEISNCWKCATSSDFYSISRNIKQISKVINANLRWHFLLQCELTINRKLQ